MCDEGGCAPVGRGGGCAPVGGGVLEVRMWPRCPVETVES